jgi:hypothetical protein
MVVSVGVLLVLNTVDDTIKSEQEIEENFGIPVVGKISNISMKEVKLTKMEQTDWKARGDSVGT